MYKKEVQKLKLLEALCNRRLRKCAFLLWGRKGGGSWFTDREPFFLSKIVSLWSYYNITPALTVPLGELLKWKFADRKLIVYMGGCLPPYPPSGVSHCTSLIPLRSIRFAQFKTPLEF